jgi:hypothetical protein
MAFRPLLSLRRAIAAGLSVTALAATASPTKANLVQNGEFSLFTLPTGVGLVPGDSFSFGTQVTDWSVGIGGTAIDNGRVYLYAPNTATTTGALYTPDGAGRYYVVLSGTAADYPDPNNLGNFVGIDSGFGYTLSQTITSLLPNTKYLLSFDTAAAQQTIASGGLGGATTDYWQVTLGGTSSMPVTTPVINNLSEGFKGWIPEELTFTTPSVLTNDTLQFLAVGSPTGVPPFALLDSVNLAIVPEPSTWTMMLIGFASLGFVGYRASRKSIAPKARHRMASL